VILAPSILQEGARSMKLTTTEADDTGGSIKDFWSHHVQSHQFSALSKTEYCKQNQLNYHRFLYWCNKLTKTDKNVSGDKSPFIPIKLKSTTSSSSCLCTLELSCGNRLLIHDEPTLQLLLFKLLK